VVYVGIEGVNVTVIVLGWHVEDEGDPEETTQEQADETLVQSCPHASTMREFPICV
jgi:hypothetical protein